MFPLDLLGVSCGRDIDEALGIFPFTRDVSLGLLAVEEEEAGADILGILETVDPAAHYYYYYYYYHHCYYQTCRGGRAQLVGRTGAAEASWGGRPTQGSVYRALFVNPAEEKIQIFVWAGCVCFLTIMLRIMT